MARRILTLLLAAAAGPLVGCAGTWDKVSSRKFREDPFNTLFNREDPMTVLRNKVDGNARADAMRRLKEPAKDGKPAEEQREALAILWTAATTDASPIVRTAAIDALGRFDDPEAVRLLIDAYRKADGVTAAADPTRTADGKIIPAAAIDPMTLMAPTGFEPAFVATLRARTVDALARKSDPQAVAFLAKVATTVPDPEAGAGPADRDVRAAAVRGLGKMHSRESVVALNDVLRAEAGRDVVLTQNAHAGLKELTGQDLPADPEQWSKVIQAGGGAEPKPRTVIERMGWSGK